MRKIVLPVIFALLIVGFWISPNFQEIAAGVAIFLFGMLALEDGFKLFSGGFLERVLARATSSLPRSLAFGIVSTTIMQSSSLVSVITISFLSAGLISLVAGVGIVFGANIGTTTGAWLVAGIGLKVKISAYAMPMLALGIILVFQRGKYLRGAGYTLTGLGFLFLGIHHMKLGFESFKDQFDLARLAMTGALGLVVYTLVGTAATVVMQSSHASMVLIITALAAGQVSYENALALAIGANIGTTITAILGSLTSDFQGKRLALAHLIFNVVTAAVAIVFIGELRDAVDWVSTQVRIGNQDYALKLAVFHTIFNSIGVVIMVALLRPLIRFLFFAIPEPTLDVSKPKYLYEAADEFPATIEIALRKELKHLYENAEELIVHGLNLHRHQIFSSDDLATTVASSRSPFEFDLDARYEQRVKTLYSAIVEFATRSAVKDLPQETIQRINGLRDAAGHIVQAVKAVKHMRRNATRYTSGAYGVATDLYNELRTEMAQTLVEIRKLEEADEDSSKLWLDEQRVQIESDRRELASKVADFINDDDLDGRIASSILNDSGYAYEAMRGLVDAAREYHVDTDEAVAEVERILSIDDEEIDDMLEQEAPR
ncbi:MAG: Na/Pi cotransporter family protein [Hyphomicrobiaceae bacterium]